MELVRPCSGGKRQTTTVRDLDRASLSNGGDGGTTTGGSGKGCDKGRRRDYVATVEEASTSTFEVAEAAAVGSSSGRLWALKRRGGRWRLGSSSGKGGRRGKMRLHKGGEKLQQDGKCNGDDNDGKGCGDDVVDERQQQKTAST
ncbi:hypothetical protein GW17_00059997 [Ensete ventricosum]|nr:hypothetical protein GW17_00059997 [Ensete ventricosum]